MYVCKLQTCVNMAAVDDIPECFDGGEELVVKCLLEMRKKENRCSSLKNL